MNVSRTKIQLGTSISIISIFRRWEYVSIVVHTYSRRSSHCYLRNREPTKGGSFRTPLSTYMKIQHVHGTESRRKVLSCKSMRAGKSVTPAIPSLPAEHSNRRMYPVDLKKIGNSTRAESLFCSYALQDSSTS